METSLTTLFSRLVGRLTHPLGAAVLLLLVCFGLHRSALSGGWQFDDGAHLLMAAKYAPWQYFFVPEVMLESTYAHITPWNVFFYEMGLPFFGLNPVGHYVHLLLVLWGVAYATFFLLGEWLPKPYALFGAVLFLAMPPVAGVAQMLMVGHYVYGLLFTVLALLAFNRAVLTGQTRYALLTAGLYALACLCKELYVPLPAVLLFLPVKTWQLRLRCLLGVAVVAVAYLGFRWWVLGGIGGYGTGQTIAFTVYFHQLQQALFGSKYPYWLSAGFGLAWLGVMVRGGWRYGGLLGIILGALLLPMLAVASMGLDGVSIRYAFVFAWVVAIGWVFAARLLIKREPSWWLSLVGVAVLLALVLVQNTVPARDLISGQVNRWLTSHAAHPKQVLFTETEAGFSKEMAKAQALLGGSAHKVIMTRAGIAQLADDVVIFTYQAACQCVQPLAEGKAGLMRSWHVAAAAGQAQPLAVRVWVKNVWKNHGRRTGAVAWAMSPYQEGVYWVTLENPVMGMGLPAQGSNALSVHVEALRLRIRYTSPQGWTVETPELTLPLEQGAEVRWEKPLKP